MKVHVAADLVTTEGPLELDASFELEEGRVGALLGRSGAGKTTILRAIAGLHRPKRGRIEVAGRVWFDSEAGVDLPPQERQAGFVFQDYALFPNMTVEENLRFALPRGADPAIIEELLAMTELAELRGRRPQRLSGGQKQRVALARALVPRPPLLLLDEPLSALDPETRQRLQDELKALHARFGTTTLLVSHDPAEVRRLAGTAFRLAAGRVSAAPLPEGAR